MFCDEIMIIECSEFPGAKCYDINVFLTVSGAISDFIQLEENKWKTSFTENNFGWIFLRTTLHDDEIYHLYHIGNVEKPILNVIEIEQIISVFNMIRLGVRYNI